VDGVIIERIANNRRQHVGDKSPKNTQKTNKQKQQQKSATKSAKK